MTPPWCTVIPHGVRLALQVTPNAPATAIVGVVDGALKLKLKARPVDGQANAAMVKWLAATLKVPRSAVAVSHGASNRRKLVEVTTPDPAAVAAVLAALATLADAA